jgi:hypothetical protein
MTAGRTYVVLNNDITTQNLVITLSAAVSEINYAALNVDFYSHTFTDQDGNPLILEIIDANVNAQITGNVLWASMLSGMPSLSLSRSVLSGAPSPSVSRLQSSNPKDSDIPSFWGPTRRVKSICISVKGLALDSLKTPSADSPLLCDRGFISCRTLPVICALTLASIISRISGLPSWSVKVCIAYLGPDYREYMRR